LPRLLPAFLPALLSLSRCPFSWPGDCDSVGDLRRLGITVQRAGGGIHPSRVPRPGTGQGGITPPLRRGGWSPSPCGAKPVTLSSLFSRGGRQYRGSSYADLAGCELLARGVGR
jgi:hypothetical protein